MAIYPKILLFSSSKRHYKARRYYPVFYATSPEKCLLEIRERKIAIHPMTQMLEENPWKDQVAKELRIEGDVQFILRVGYLESYPGPVSLRRPVAWFTNIFHREIY